MDKFPMIKPSSHCHINEYGGGNYMLCLLWAELEYDVKYALWRRSKTLSQHDDTTEALTITDDDQDFLLRSFSDAVNNIKGKLKPYVTNRSRMACDELLDVPSDYNISLHFDEGWLGQANVLLTYAHDYVTNYTLSELMALNNDPLASSYQAKASYCLNHLYDEANSFNLINSPIFTL